jgi:hypothetical protein
MIHLANAVFSAELVRCYDDKGLVPIALNPGMEGIATDEMSIHTSFRRQSENELIQGCLWARIPRHGEWSVDSLTLL